MSNNLASKPLSVLNNQMDPVSDEIGGSIPNMRMGMTGDMSISPTVRHFEIPIKQMEPVSNNHRLPNLFLLNKHMEQMEPQVNHPGLQQFFVPNQPVGGMEDMLNGLGSPKMSSPNKRKAVGEPMFRNFVAHPLSMLNKNVAHTEPFTGAPGLQQLSTPNKNTTQVYPTLSTPVSQNLPGPTKKMVRNESIPGRSGTKQLQNPKTRTIQMGPSSKVQTEPVESVRSKMRESLASALALVTQQQDKASNEENNSETKVAITLPQTQQDSQQAESTCVPSVDHVFGNNTGSLALKESCAAYKANDGNTTSQGMFKLESMGDSAQAGKADGPLIQCNTVLPNEDVSFGDSYLVNDDLLQGNGLAWAIDIDVDVEENKEIQIAKKPKLVNEDVGRDVRGQAVQSPKSLAFKIEGELFKLFGGVNKKYKERGRSLLFNLKDRSNPELRERVMSGEIPPERLCSMTVEELASKELSQWRIAKAEELAQMVVLPDSDVDIRRLVRKTHKGEFQVEVEQDDGVSVELSVGASSLIGLQSKSKGTEAHPSDKADEIKDKEIVVDEKRSSENLDLSCSITIPNDGTDLLQGLMVDEFKDAEFLPPIVSLDEFMESLDSEPPFVNLPVDDGKAISPSDKDSDLGAKDPVGTTPEKSVKVDVKDTDSDEKTKSTESSKEPKSSPPAAASKGYHVWEGVLQLNISAMVTVVGFFRSGEKTLTKEWPSSLDIKGRVRLDAFEKFLQQLPMSRSRAVMVVHFVLKEGSSANDRSSLSEVVDSYVLDERLGFAEPSPGVEIYFCPPHTKIVEMLTKNLSNDHTEILNSIDSGLIGIIVWRKAHLSSTISPNNTSSHHKHSSKRHHFTSRKDSNVNANVNFASKPTSRHARIEDDDDVPPGFGPGAAREEDDLPEFSFSGPTNRSMQKQFNQGPSMAAHPLPVDQMRQLIQKYGQPGSNSNIASRNVGQWNDDDDDIPEWQPQPQPMLNFQLPHAVNQHPGVEMQRLQMVAPPPPVNMVQGLVVGLQQGGGRWGQPPGYGGSQPSNLGSQQSGGQWH